MDDFSYQQKSFDSQAKHYEKLYGSESEFEKEIVEKRKQLILDSAPSKIALDLGCGTGTFFKYLSKKARKVFAVDASKEMIKKAQKRIEKEKLSNIKTFFADATALPFEDNFFEAVYCINTFYHIKEKERTVKEISRVLKKGGTAFIEFYNVLNPLVFLRFLANPFAKNMPHVYPDFIPRLKLRLKKNNLETKNLYVFSFVETSQAVRQWLPGPLFGLLLKYRKFSDRHALFRLPKMRCVVEVKKN